MTQAPGDSTSIYIVERADSGNTLGKIRNYNLQTGMFTTFLDLPGTINSDGGLLSMRFHPDYQSNGLFYVVSNDTGTNGLDEYKVVSGTPQLQRRLLQYQNLNNVFHTMNEVHFRPNGNNNELFVTTGDGGTQADDPDYDPALIENPDSPYGKLMKINLAASFPTPATGPTHAGIDVVALGLRNPYRSGFDRQTGDFYFGDVGFNTAEEVDFIPASHFANPAPPVLDFGWTDREGTVATVAPFAGGPGSPGDINPIFDYAHGGQPLPHPSLITGQSITAGYVYRGPVSELQGRYFFSDFINGNVYSGTFNTSTPVSAYNGTNLTGLIDHTTAFETSIGGGANIRNVTSFAEDNAGNLYIVKFGNGFFPPLGQGEIFRIRRFPRHAGGHDQSQHGRDHDRQLDRRGDRFHFADAHVGHGRNRRHWPDADHRPLRRQRRPQCRQQQCVEYHIASAKHQPVHGSHNRRSRHVGRRCLDRVFRRRAAGSVLPSRTGKPACS